MSALWMKKGTGPLRRGVRPPDGEGPPAVPQPNGFSLIEVMVATAILGFGLLGVGSMMFRSMESDRVNTRSRIAYREASTMLEQIKSRSSNFPEGTALIEFFGDASQTWHAVRNAGDWLRRDFGVIFIQPLRLKQITVDMYWVPSGASDVQNAGVGVARFRRFTAVSYVK